MNEKQTDVTQVDQAPKSEHPEEVLSPKRRTALVTYLAILFAVAFLFVALVMVMETKRLRTMNQELQDTNQKTSASLTGNINALQEENQILSDTNKDLEEQVAELQAQLDAAQTSLQQRDQSLETLTGEKEALIREKEALETEKETLSQQLQDAKNVSELVYQAVAANEEGDLETLKSLLDQIAELKDFLSPTEQEVVDSLHID